MIKNNFPNILLITLDAFNYNIALDNISSLPTFKKIYRNSISFENAFSIGPNTFFSFPGIISSIYPYYFGVGIPRDVETIASILKQQGYATALINESNALLTPYYGYDKGVDYYEHFLEKSHDKNDRILKETFINKHNFPRTYNLRKLNIFRVSKLFRKSKCISSILHKTYSLYRFANLKLSDKTECYAERRNLHKTFKSKINWFISTQFRNPQFLWIHTIINHLPYLPPDTRKFSEDEINYLNYIGLSKFTIKYNIKKLKKLYIESLKTTDRFLEFIITKLAENNVLENTILIITADHGEEFMEHTEYYEHNPESSSDDLLHVPLIFYNLSNFLEDNYADYDNPKIKAPVSTIDILPTIMDLMGFPNKWRDKLCGCSLLPIISTKKINNYSPRTLYSEAWKIKSILDRSPGYLHSEFIFTVRYNNFKLKTILNKKHGYYIEKSVQLYDWTNNEKLNINDYYEEYIKLYSLLVKHLYEKFIFSKKIKHDYEKQKLKRYLIRSKNKF